MDHRYTRGLSMQLGLGTVQFGLDYGITNASGQVTLEEAERILALCAKSHIDLFDTAAAYGDSERVLGQLLPTTFKDKSEQVVTKLPPCEQLDLGEIDRLFRQSLKNLKRERIYGLMLHYGADLLAPQGKEIYNKLQEFQSEGRVEKIGVSVYEPEITEDIFERYDLDLVQLPLNVLDQRFITSGVLAKLKAKGVEVHVRSAFLQGLLLMEFEALPDYFRQFNTELVPYFEARGAEPLVPAIQFIKRLGLVDQLIVGVTNQMELAQILNAYNQDNNPISQLDVSRFACSDERLILPTNWP